MRSLSLPLCALAACATAASTPVRSLQTTPPAARFVPRAPVAPSGTGVAWQRSLTVVRAAHPIQFPRSYWVGSELWTTFSTVAQDSMEVHVARSDLAQRAVLRTELVTPTDHRMSAFASLAQSPERVAIAFDDDAYGGRSTRFVMFDRPRPGAPIAQPSRTEGLWANTSSAAIAYSPTLREWSTLSVSNEHFWSLRLTADGTLIEGSGVRLAGLRYEHRCGARWLWNGSQWVGLLQDEQGGFSFFERDARQSRVRSLGLRANGTLADAAFAHARGRYAIAWVDDAGVRVSILHDRQQFSSPRTLSLASARPGTPVIAHDGQRFVLLWTETADRSTLHRAYVSEDGVATQPELVASHPTEHVWWPHITPREGDHPTVFTFQVGQSEARVWTDEG